MDRDELVRRIGRIRTIIEGLENHEPFKMMVSDFQNTLISVDSSWHTVLDAKRLEELRVNKLAAVSILNCLDHYKHDMNILVRQLAEMDYPDKIQNSYVDKE